MLTKQEKMRLEAAERETWSDEKMVKYCVNQALLIHDLRGKIIVIEKKSIKTNFCFGYSLSRYDSEDFDNANAMAAYAQKNQQYFIKENHDNAGYSRMINLLNDGRFRAYARPQYYSGKTIYSVNVCRFWEDIPEGAFELTDTEKAAYKRRLSEACKIHHKKIMSYLKRYGMEKVNTWSYWRDE